MLGNNTKESEVYASGANCLFFFHEFDEEQRVMQETFDTKARHPLSWGRGFSRAANDSKYASSGGANTIQARSLSLPVVHGCGHSALSPRSLTSNTASAASVAGGIADSHRRRNVSGIAAPCRVVFEFRLPCQEPEEFLAAQSGVPD